jgi:hypothetical protein
LALAEIWLAVLTELTETGVAELVLRLSPSWPDVPRPQHLTDPDEAPEDAPKIPHEKDVPTAMSTGLATPATITAPEAGEVVPSPSCPKPLLPQHFTVSSARRAHVWVYPGAIFLIAALPSGFGTITVNDAEEVAFPEGETTEMGPVAFPMEGTVMTSCVLDALVTAAVTPDTVTVISAILVGKLLPVTVTEVPGAPLIGVKPEIAGAAPPPPPGPMLGKLSHHCWAAVPQNLLPNCINDWQPV